MHGLFWKETKHKVGVPVCVVQTVRNRSQTEIAGKFGKLVYTTERIKKNNNPVFVQGSGLTFV